MRIDLGTLSWLITWFHFDLCRKCIYGNMRAGLVAIELVRIDLVTPSCWLITWFHFDLCRNASTRQATCILWIVTSSPRICLSMTLCSFRNLDLHSLTWKQERGDTHDDYHHGRMLTPQQILSKTGRSYGEYSVVSLCRLWNTLQWELAVLHILTQVSPEYF